MDRDAVPGSAGTGSDAKLFLGCEPGFGHQLYVFCHIFFQKVNELVSGGIVPRERIVLGVFSPLRFGNHLFQQVGVERNLFLGGSGRQEEGAQHLVLHVDSLRFAGRISDHAMLAIFFL